MSQVEVDKIIPQSGTTLTIGDSGDTITIASGATLSGSLNADNLDSGTVPDARITGAYTGITNLTMSGDLTVDTNTLKVDSANNRVGIGTSSPQGNLSVEGEGRIVTIGDSGTVNVPEIRARNSADTSNAYLRISSYSTQFYTEGSERMRIDPNGKVGIGTSTPSNTLHVQNTTSSGGLIEFDGQSNNEFGLRIESNISGGNFEGDFASGGGILDLFANSAVTSGGDILVARTQASDPVFLVKGNGRVGIGTGSPDSRLEVLDSSATGIISRSTSTQATDSNKALRVRNNSDTDTFAVSYKGSVFLGSGTGIYFDGSTSGSNQLDDYEEGTWTPTFTSGANTLTITGGTQNYKYIKIGKTCFISINIENATVSGTTSASDQRITLPFTAVSGIRQTTSNVSFNTTGGLRYTTPDWIYGVMESTIIQLYGSDNLGYNPQPGAPTTGSGTYFFLTATYETA